MIAGVLADDSCNRRIGVNYMTEWTVLIWAGVCSAGVLQFLGLVALGVKRADSDLRNLESEERKSYERRLDADIYVADASSENDVGVSTVAT